MSELISFVQLDFMTVKPYLKVTNLLIYTVATVLLTFMMQSTAGGAFVGFLLAIQLIGYPFSLGEKGTMDALYPTLSFSRKKVVAGRYLFSLILDLCIIVYVMVLSFLCMHIAEVLAFPVPISSSCEAFAVFCGFILFFQSFQLPLYFKLGYSKGRFLGFILPIAATMALSFVLTALMRINSELETAAEKIFLMIFLQPEGNVLLVVGLISLLFLIVCFIVSYKLSQSFYSKREF